MLESTDIVMRASPPVTPARYDVIVVGGGNAGYCAAHAAREHVGRVLILEKAPRERAGGNSYFTAGAFRTAYQSLDRIRSLLPSLSDAEAALIDLPVYDESAFHDDMRRLTYGRCDAELTAILVGDSWDTVTWLGTKGINWELLYLRQSFPSGDRIRFFGGLAVGVAGGGKGLMRQHLAIARRDGIEVRYAAPAIKLTRDPTRRVTGVVIDSDAGRETIGAGAVVL